jgi:RDD family protein
METKPQTDEESLEVVRRRDLGEAARWRRIWALVVDLALHLTVALLVASRLDFPFLFTAVAAYSVVSFVHRVPLQWWWGATTGRALFGLRCVVEATGGKPALEMLLKEWLLTAYALVVFAVLPLVDAIPN